MPLTRKRVNDGRKLGMSTMPACAGLIVGRSGVANTSEPWNGIAVLSGWQSRRTTLWHRGKLSGCTSGIRSCMTRIEKPLASFSSFFNGRVASYGFYYRSSIMDDKVKIRCPACKRVFREKARRVRDGAQMNCPDCCRLITLSSETEDPFIRRALKTAKEIRAT